MVKFEEKWPNHSQDIEIFIKQKTGQLTQKIKGELSLMTSNFLFVYFMSDEKLIQELLIRVMFIDGWVGGNDLSTAFH